MNRRFFQITFLCGILSVLAVAAHACFMPYARDLWSWDTGPFLLVAEDVLHGKVSAFYYNHYYGGAVLSLLHGAWLFLVQSFSHLDLLWAHHSFYFAVVPILLSLTTFWGVLVFTSLPIGFLVALIPAFGFHSWIFFYSATEYYIAGFLLGMVQLVLRYRWGNPLLLKDRLRSFLFGLLIGFSIYTYRATLVYGAAVLISPEWVKNEFRFLINEKKRFASVLRRVIAVFLFFYVALDLLNRHLGTYQGREIKLDAKPNLQIAIFFAGVLWVLVRGKTIREWKGKAFIALGTGLFVGFSPELFATIRAGVNHSGGATLSSLRHASATLILLPDRLGELLTSTYEAPFHSLSQPWLQFASLTLVVSGIAFLIRRSKIGGRTDFLGTALFLALLTFCGVSSYTTGATRWLFSSLPIIFVGLGFFIQEMSRKGWKFQILIFVLFGLHFGIQASERVTILSHLNPVTTTFFAWSLGRTEDYDLAVETFKKVAVRVVVVDSHFWSNNSTVLSKRKPIFISEEWSMTEGYALAAQEERIGLIVKQGTLFPFHFRGRAYFPEREIGHTGDDVFFLARAAL